MANVMATDVLNTSCASSSSEATVSERPTSPSSLDPVPALSTTVSSSTTNRSIIHHHCHKGSATATATATAIASHYTSHSDGKTYEDAYFYEPGAYTRYVRDLVHTRLGLLVVDKPPEISLSSNDPDSNSTVVHHHNSRSDSVVDGGVRILLDIGGGTGNFTRLLIESSNDVSKVITPLHAIVVDPYLVEEEEKEEAATDPQLEKESSIMPFAVGRLSFVKAGAEAFLTSDMPSLSSSHHDHEEQNLMWWKRRYHQVLMKEVIHHLPSKDRVAIFSGIRSGLQPLPSCCNKPIMYPSILIITRPQFDIDYPLWDAARQVWAAHQPSLDELVHDLHEAGFVDIEHSIESYPCCIALSRWQTMIRQRFWSVFYHFTDDELEHACQQLEIADSVSTNKSLLSSSQPQQQQQQQQLNSNCHYLDAEGNLHFEDRLIFLTAKISETSDSKNVDLGSTDSKKNPI